ncbi:hypothetical protein P691DRAFT_762292 [Macrolepiota fuliginosa MF-IS2]|uniref:Uncharacterized protein n=1 Tax=Macrolepiota fuliginosa MF-IS2 TaxID=1400762 RepID=A0A9P6C1T0_9AGAR|nr:hypothetical protein P691DRAFT_762292 [Macrolepiota fuliginosa MF-IS2]
MSSEDNSNLAKALEKSKEFYIPERFHLGAGRDITTTAVKAALKFPVNQLRKDFNDYHNLEGRGLSHN